MVLIDYNMTSFAYLHGPRDCVLGGVGKIATDMTQSCIFYYPAPQLLARLAVYTHLAVKKINCPLSSQKNQGRPCSHLREERNVTVEDKQLGLLMSRGGASRTQKEAYIHQSC